MLHYFNVNKGTTVGQYSVVVEVTTKKFGSTQILQNAARHSNDNVVEFDTSVVDTNKGANYHIRLINNSAKRVAAAVQIDDVEVGNYLITAHSETVVERPQSLAKVFRFDLVDGEHGTLAGAVRGKSTNGLISVTFTSEKSKEHMYVLNSEKLQCRTRSCAPQSHDISFMNSAKEYGMTDSANSFLCCARESRTEGVTTLGENSSQRFTTVNNFEYDHSDKVTVHVRLAWTNLNDNNTTPLWKAAQVKSNPVPPPIGSLLFN